MKPLRLADSRVAARLAEQKVLDERYERRRRRSALFSLVVDVVATWDSAPYIAKHRKTVRDILALPRNTRRPMLYGLPTTARRHQVALRLVRALAFDGLSQAEYCRRHKLDQADASRMLAHLYEKEPGLRNALDAISACAAVTSWQNRQQKRMVSNSVKIIYGWNYEDVPDYGWLSGLLHDEPFTPFNLHEPSAWHGLVNSLVWGSLIEPRRDVQRFEPLPDRYRPIRRKVRFKDGTRRTLDIARALDGQVTRAECALSFFARPVTTTPKLGETVTMAEDLIVRLPGRLRASLEEIAKEDFRRSSSDAARALLERSITDRALTKGVKKAGAS